MYGSPVPKDLNLPAQPPPMASSGLLRYRSAPSAVLGGLCEDQLQIPAAPGAAAADNVFSRFLTDDKPSPTPAHFASAADMASQHHQQQQMMFHSQSQSQQQTGRSGGGLYRTVSSGIEAGGAAASSLIRQSSSPAGFLDHFGMDNGYGAMLRASMGMGFQDGGASDSLAGGGGSGRLGGQLSFSSRQGSLMSQISEMDSQDQEEDVGASSPDAAGGRGAAYIPGYPMSSAGWDDSSAALLPDSLPATTKRPRDSSEHGGGLAHQFSLPKTSSSSEMAAIEKFLQFQQDAVPCKVRAKRGCATHPRSIAERVRRTKISERIRKLQELVPDMDKQTNTSDMLDLAVDYIKDLQKQVKALNESRASCTCPASKHQQFSG